MDSQQMAVIRLAVEDSSRMGEWRREPVSIQASSTDSTSKRISGNSVFFANRSTVSKNSRGSVSMGGASSSSV